MSLFSTYGLSPDLLAAIEASGYVTPTPIQEQALPVVLAGQDVMGLAQTGTGKTAAFVLPMLQRFLKGPKGKVRGLIIAPTRELAEQIHETIRALGKRTGIRSVTVYGGVNINTQIRNLRQGADIVVACPGRLLDHLGQGTLSLDGIEVLVLDEADHMFDMGFLPDIRRVLKQVPAVRQTLLFSATMPEDIRRLANAILKNPVILEVSNTRPVDAITHAIFPVKSHLKTDLLFALLKRTDTKSILIFTKTKHRAKSLDLKLQSLGYKSASLQGNLSQNRRQEALNGFRTGQYQIMVATDIAARGIDISLVSHVINYDVPDTPEAYTHRIGRTGRASRTGDAFTFVTPEDSGALRGIERRLGAPIPKQFIDDFNYDALPDKKPEFPRAPRPPRGPGKSRRQSSGFSGKSDNPRSSHSSNGPRKPGSSNKPKPKPRFR
ncbi:MAG: DEAD/DEAH box helicase [Candidatus Margulisiibacteriota bacterium]